MALSFRRKVISGGGGGVEDDESSGSYSSSSRSTYQVYRGLSPTTSNRLENRIKELEEALEAERANSARGDKDIAELHVQIDILHDRLEEFESESSLQIENSRRREQDYLKLKKDFDLLTAHNEASEASLKKRHQEIIAELTEQLDRANKQRAKVEKEKQTLVIEIELFTSQLEAANKNKGYAEGKLEGLEDQVRKLKVQLDDATKTIHDLTSGKTRLQQENAELQRLLQDSESSAGSFSKVRLLLQGQADEFKAKYEEESRLRGQLDSQFGNLQGEFDRLHAAWEDESEEAASLRSQLQRLQTEYQTLRGKYDTDVSARTEELDELRRRTNGRISELESELDQAKSKASRLEKEKSKLTVEINEITIQLDSANNVINDHAKRLKQAEFLSFELQKRVEELTTDLTRGGSDLQNATAELVRLKASLGDAQGRVDALTRENSKLTESHRESETSIKELTRQVNDLLAVRNGLQGDKDALGNDLSDAHDVIRDLEARLDSANAALNQLRLETDNRLREKDEEIENTRRGGQAAIEELRRTIIDLEARLKAEAARLKKKYEAEHHEFEIQIDGLGRTNADLAKSNKSLSIKLKDTEASLDLERRGAGEARESLTLLERKVILLQTELADIHTLLDAAEKARKKAELELNESSSHFTEINITITNLTSEKRRLEQELLAIQHDFDDSQTARRSAEERADKLALEVARLGELLKRGEENYSSLEQSKKQLEIHIREITIRLEESESSKDGRKALYKLQSRVSELEKELDQEQRRGRDSQAEVKRLQKLLAELRVQADSDHRLVLEFTDSNSGLQARILSLKRQLEHSEDVVGITMNKYRKCQQELEEAQRRADRAEKNISVVRHTTVMSGIPTGPRTQRAMSVSRETTKIVRV